MKTQNFIANMDVLQYAGKLPLINSAACFAAAEALGIQAPGGKWGWRGPAAGAALHIGVIS